MVDGRPGPELMRPMIVSRHSGPMRAAAAADLVCVPEMAVPPGEPLDGRFREEVAWLRERYAAGATIASACSGAILLAEAGLLDGRDATTHWAYCDIMRRRYPAVTVHPERALVLAGEGQRLVMAGGGTSWLDVALYLIARFAGVDAAMQVAKLNLIDWHVAGQQIARCQAWIAEHYREPSPVAAMVRLSGIAERSFKRRFRAATGMSPLEYVHTLLEAAKEMLETSDRPAEAIALEVGYEDAGFSAALPAARAAHALAVPEAVRRAARRDDGLKGTVLKRCAPNVHTFHTCTHGP